MKYIKNEKGYALLLTLVLLILFSILGTSLIVMSSNGTAKNEVRQDITQSSDLSQKGIDLVTTQVNSELTAFLGANGKPRTEFIFQLERILDSYRCIGGTATLPVNNETGTYKACIESYVNTIDKDNNPNPLKKLVTFKSVGKAGNSNKTLTSKIEIGAATAPEALRYAIGTNMDTTDGTSPGEGNLLMHGGVDIKGDIKVDGDIVTSTNGYAYLGGDKWIPSVAPSAIPLDGTPSARLFLGKKAYAMNNSITYSSHITRSNFTGNSNYGEKSKIEDLFRTGFAPTLVSREPVQNPIAINAQKSSFEYYSNAAGVSLVNAGSNLTISGQNLPTSKVYFHHDYINRVCSWWSCTDQRVNGESETYTLSGINSFKQASTKGSVNLINTNTTFKTGMYVNGNLDIGNGSTSYDVTKYSDVTLDGPIYVNGNLTIQGADLKSNALIYVNGTVNILHSRINGKSLASSKTGSLIIFSKGNIKISNNSVNYDDPSYIKGFFYSEQDFEMFGVGSNMKIEGGISARRIVLNAIRGRAKDYSFSGATRISNTDYFEGVAVQNKPETQSRLQVIYDLDIISTYSDLKQQEPVIYAVDTPTEKDRGY
ncbi:hypothetical protein [Planococcus sp. YIM B11945]|uniref:hypothetical protein n=1 Tax=Planococcus sp. YIM B11945 TaxID=3435410 RepID=UPI003D7E5197